MVKVVFEGSPYELPQGVSLLEGLLSQGVKLPYGCKTGSCQSCLLKCTKGSIPVQSQKGLKEAHRLNHYFLSCQCIPTEEMCVALPNLAGERLKATVTGLRLLAPSIMEVRLEPHGEMNYRAGQFIQLYHPEGQARSYSLASVPSLDVDLILHVRKFANGRLSSWIHHDLRVGHDLRISEALGDCFYLPGHSEQPLLLIGTGTGLAPLLGIIKDALEQGHHAPIHLFHGSRDLDGLYLSSELNLISKAHPRFSYTACISNPDVDLTEGVSRGRASDIALATYPDLKGWKVYLCGHPVMVRATQMQAFLANAALSDIHIDPFESQSYGPVST